MSATLAGALCGVVGLVCGVVMADGRVQCAHLEVRRWRDRARAAEAELGALLAAEVDELIAEVLDA